MAVIWDSSSQSLSALYFTYFAVLKLALSHPHCYLLQVPCSWPCLSRHSEFLVEWMNEWMNAYMQGLLVLVSLFLSGLLQNPVFLSLSSSLLMLSEWYSQNANQFRHPSMTPGFQKASWPFMLSPLPLSGFTSCHFSLLTLEFHHVAAYFLSSHILLIV